MPIEVTKRPYSYSFSGNPLHYELYSAQAAANPETYFELRLCYQPNGGALQRTESFPYTPVGGVAEADVKDLVEGFLSYNLPQLIGPPTTVWPAPGQTGYFYLEFRQITPQNPSPSWDSSESEFAFLCVKGGVARFRYQGNNFFTNYFDADVPAAPRPWFTWQESGRLATRTERMYLAYLLIDEIAISGLGEFVVKAKATYTDGSTLVHSAEMATQTGQVYYIPAGAGQWAFPTIKQLWFWEIWIEHLPTATVYSQVFRYESDNRYTDSKWTLHYRNSLGGLDSVRLRGVVKTDREFVYTEMQRIQRPHYFDGPSYDPQQWQAQNIEQKVWRGDIGHLGKEEQDRLTDLYLRRETWFAAGGKWVPVLNVTKSLPGTRSDGTLWSLPIDFSLAHDGDSSYTPDSVDLGEGQFTSNVCRAFLSSFVKTITDGAPGQKNISIAFTEVDPDGAATQIRWRVMHGNGILEFKPWVTQAFVTPLEFSLPANGLYLLEIRSVCANAVFGKKSTVGIRTNANSAGANNSVIENDQTGGFVATLTLNGVVVVDHEYIGGYSNSYFNIAPGVGQVYQLQTEFGSPSQAVLFDGNNYFLGTITTVNNITIIDFPPVDVAAGIKITLS